MTTGCMFKVECFFLFVFFCALVPKISQVFLLAPSDDKNINHNKNNNNKIQEYFLCGEFVIWGFKIQYLPYVCRQTVLSKQSGSRSAATE